MKARLNFSVDKQLLLAIRKYAARNNTTLSKLVSDYFIKILSTFSTKRTTIIDLVEQIRKPDMQKGTELRELYYEERGNRQ